MPRGEREIANPIHAMSSLASKNAEQKPNKHNDQETNNQNARKKKDHHVVKSIPSLNPNLQPTQSKSHPMIPLARFTWSSRYIINHTFFKSKSSVK